MIARFDKFARFEEPNLYLCSPGCKYENGRLTRVAGILSAISDEEIVFNFNAESELSFRAYKIRSNDKTEESNVNRLYRTLQNKRLIFVDDVGFFVVTKVVEGWSDGQQYKDITAISVEYELECKLVPYIEDNTYPFVSIIEKLIGPDGVANAWSIGHIDDGVRARYRTFEDVGDDINIFSFMIDTLQDAYECIFVCDPINRVVNAYDAETYLNNTDIHITRDDLIESMDITENADDLYTAISVLGSDNLSINAINPLGTNIIYRFDYYLDWMNNDLANKVKAWQDKVKGAAADYFDKNVQYYADLQTQYDLKSEIDKYDIQLTQYKRCRDNIIAEGNISEVVSYNAVIEQAGGATIPSVGTESTVVAAIDQLIADAEAGRAEASADYDTATSRIENEKDAINAIRSSCMLTNNFTQDELNELSEYIEEGSYTDEYITITDSMTYPEQLEQMKILYDRAVVQIGKISEPTYEYSVSVADFIFIKDFSHWTDQIETGCLINVELERDDVAELFLSTMTVNYDEKSLDLTFGNRYNKYDQRSLYEDALGDIKRTANTVAYLKDVTQPLSDGKLNKIEADLASARDLSKIAVLTSTNQDIIIDDTGYTGRQTDPATGEVSSEQIKINHQNIVFTDDKWDTAKLAIGKIMTPDDGYKYGINAETVIGDMIIGGGLNITTGDDADRTGFVIDGSGVHVYHNDVETITLNALTGMIMCTGEINATSGTIGSEYHQFTIGGDDNRAFIYSGINSSTGSGDGIYIGTDGINLGGMFKVNTTGTLTVGPNNTYKITIGGSSNRAFIYSGEKNTYESESSGIYIGTDGINMFNTFMVDTDGNAEFKGQVHAGNIISDSTDGVTDTMSAIYITNYTINGGSKIQAGTVTGGSNGSIGSGTISTANTTAGINTSLGYADYANGVFNNTIQASYVCGKSGIFDYCTVDNSAMVKDTITINGSSKNIWTYYS